MQRKDGRRRGGEGNEKREKNRLESCREDGRGNSMIQNKAVERKLGERMVPGAVHGFSAVWASVVKQTGRPA